MRLLFVKRNAPAFIVTAKQLLRHMVLDQNKIEPLICYIVKLDFFQTKILEIWPVRNHFHIMLLVCLIQNNRNVVQYSLVCSVRY